MLRRFEIDKGVLVASENDSAQILVLSAPDAAERERLVQEFDLDDHTVGSALDPDEQARLEQWPEYTAVIIKRPQNYSSKDQFVFKVSSVGIFYAKGKLVFVAPEDFPLFEGKQFQKVVSLPDVMLKVISRTIFHFYGHLKAINAISTEIEQKINTSMENRYLIHMFTLEKSLVYYVDALNSNEVAVECLRNNAQKLGMSAEAIDLLEDIIVENRQCARQSEIYSNILSSLMDARASIVNNNLNILMKRLTVINVVFMPLNIVAGIGGMSEYTRFTTGIPWPVAYGMFVLGLIGVATLTYWVLRKLGLEGSRPARRPVR